MPLAVGSAVAWASKHTFDPYWFVMAFVGLVLIEIGKHGVNELVDFYSGVDEDIPSEKQTPFTGGPRTVTQHILAPARWSRSVW